MKTEEKPSPPTLDHAELVAADLISEGGTQRQRRLQELDHLAKQRESEAGTLSAIVKELAGESAGGKQIEAAKARIDAAEAERRNALDALAAEQRSIELAVSEGIKAMGEIGSTKATSAFMSSAQGKALADRGAVIRRALMAAGASDHPVPEHVEKVLKSRSLGRSDAFKAFLAKSAEVGRALGLPEHTAIAKARETHPDMLRAATDEPLVMPASGSVAKAMTEISKSAMDRASDDLDAKIAEARSYVNTSRLTNAIGWPGLPDAAKRESIRKAAATMTVAEIIEACARMTPDQRAQVLAALDDPKTLADVQARAAALGGGEATTKSHPGWCESGHGGAIRCDNPNAGERIEKKAEPKPFATKNSDGSWTYADGRRIRYY